MVSSDSGNEFKTHMLRTPWCASWWDQVRPGDRFDTDPVRREAAWAGWAVQQFAGISNGKRTYAAIFLDGDFYTPNGGPRVKPHLEIPEKTQGRPDPLFPKRLSLAGNGVAFPTWMYPEVTAIRRALFNHTAGPIEELADMLIRRQPSLRRGLEELSRAARPQWGVIQDLLASDPETLKAAATGPFSTEAIAKYVPAATTLRLRVEPEAQLLEKNGKRAASSVGIWRVTGQTSEGDSFSQLAITPRLTRSSMFSDPMFNPASESVLALLVRGLILRRIVASHLDGVGAKMEVAASLIETADPSTADGFLRAVPAKQGQKLPIAKPAAVAAFVRTHPDAEAAWAKLQEWAGSRYMLTTHREEFDEAHRRASQALNRAEEIPDKCCEVLLSIAWDNENDKPQVVRPTYVGGLAPRTVD